MSNKIPAKQRVLNALREKGATGVTALDFPTGFGFRSRIADLRLNHKIVSKKCEDMPLFRYWLVD